MAVFSRILFHESFSSRKGIALGLALFGTALVCFSGGSLNAEPSVLGIVCGLISGLCYASHFPFYVWWQPRYSTATLYAYMLLGGALALFPFVDFAPTRSWTAWALSLIHIWSFRLRRGFLRTSAVFAYSSSPYFLMNMPLRVVVSSM